MAGVADHLTNYQGKFCFTNGFISTHEYQCQSHATYSDAELTQLVNEFIATMFDCHDGEGYTCLGLNK